MLCCRELRRGCRGNFQLNLFWFSGECRSGILRKKALGAHLNIYCVNPSLSLINSLPNLISIKFTLKSICLHSAYDLNVIMLKYRRHSLRVLLSANSKSRSLNECLEGIIASFTSTREKNIFYQLIDDFRFLHSLSTRSTCISIFNMLKKWFVSLFIEI